jgi:hypothetical protein
MNITYSLTHSRYPILVHTTPKVTLSCTVSYLSHVEMFSGGKADVCALCVCQGIEGTAVPMVEGDNLDVTGGSDAKPIKSSSSSPTKNQADSKAQKPITTLKNESSGLGWLAKLFYISLIVAGCVIFVRSRRDRSASWREKTLA